MKASEENRMLEGLLQMLPWIVIAGGGFVLFGWAFGLEAFKTIFPGLTAMKANTALGFILAGVALLAARSDSRDSGGRTVSQASAVIVTMLGALSLGEHLSGLDFGIDEFLFRDITDLPGDIPGRMAVNTAVSFSTLGAALFFLNRKGKRFVTVIHALAFVSIIIAGTALLGYVYDIDASLREKLNYTPMAMHTALLFVLAALCV
ncbi:MAG: hypothetical protein WC291_06635, partial [Thermodesulfovibrionales bacterium]